MLQIHCSRRSKIVGIAFGAASIESFAIERRKWTEIRDKNLPHAAASDLPFLINFSASAESAFLKLDNRKANTGDQNPKHNPLQQ